jgi:hypothetical protein
MYAPNRLIDCSYLKQGRFVRFLCFSLEPFGMATLLAHPGLP